MKRRSFLKSSSAAIVGSTVGLAGCSGGSGSGSGSGTPTPNFTREVDIHEEYIEVSDWSEGVKGEDDQQAFVVEVDGKNIGDREIYMNATAKFYDSDDTLLAEDDWMSDSQHPPGESVQIRMDTKESPGEIRHYSLRVYPNVY